MGHDHYRCPVPGGDGVRAGDGGRLGAMLRAGARGMHADEAAVELLARHGHWTGHGEFARRFAQVAACPDPGGVPVACIDWQAAAGGLDGGGLLACSASEAGVLRIAASLGGGVPVSLRAVLGGLDHVNVALVARAVLHANGTTSATVTVPAPPRFPPGIEVAGAGGRARRGQGR
jgi:hypothetical protein